MARVADRRRQKQHAPVASAAPRAAPRRVPILMYHEISAEPRLAARLAVTPDTFARQLAYLHDDGFTALTVAQYAATMRGPDRELPARPIILTFDDGFADFYDDALPVLQRYGFTASLYVTTGWIADTVAPQRMVRAGRRPAGTISWSEIEAVAAAGIEIGAHSEYHQQLDQLPPGALSREVRDVKAMLEDRLGEPVTGMSYPFGYSNPRVRQATIAAGYGYACAVGNRLSGASDDLFALPRLTIGRITRPRGFARAAGAERLPPEFLAYRLLTRGYSAVRRARSALNRTSR